MAHLDTKIIVIPADDNPARGTLKIGDRTFPCALGKQGITRIKQEGDMKTPEGEFPLRSVFYRYDKLSKPIYSRMPMLALMEEDGWCDDPEDEAYNTQVMLPYHASAERLWREDDVYDVIVVLGHNDDPVEQGKGSAIFLHVAREDEGGTLKGTEGCIAVAKEDLLEILPILSPETTLKVVTH
ncbi:L,D-transpeptidase family protein [Paremcibacter congregatus]|uniref:L,D-transpeptidase family protein n=1 Tax=Paremcibacter congregatus TaxID=2043170 RepID=UPI0030EE73EA